MSHPISTLTPFPLSRERERGDHFGWLDARAAVVVALAVIVAFAAIACGGGGKSKADELFGDAQGGDYISLGDSIADGSGSSENLGYDSPVFGALLKRLGRRAILHHRASGGATTQDLIDGQLPPTLKTLRRGDVRLITITIGGNDLDILQSSPDAATCIADVDDPKCPVAKILVRTEERLDRILGELREAGPDVQIVIQVYPNLFSGTGHVFEQPAGQAFGKLNDVIERVAAKHDIQIADPRAAFEGRGDELTHTLENPPDFHPNDAGYEAIADAFIEVLGLERQ